MAKVYGVPDSIHVPSFEDYRTENGRFNLDSLLYDEQVCVSEVSEWCRANGKGPLAGEVISFSVADGRAVYVVYGPSSLVHVPVGDSYSLPEAHERGLTAADIRGHVESERSLNKLFGRV
jgi:hypothetical protein